jgi:hypothetical protein
VSSSWMLEGDEENRVQVYRDYAKGRESEAIEVGESKIGKRWGSGAIC